MSKNINKSQVESVSCIFQRSSVSRKTTTKCEFPEQNRREKLVGK